ncbi:MAG: AtpZ/AtpI family protein [Ilumatobacteraceae bacterium]|jgi:F0F1-type ATP synthase assembly protein I|nr:AtpZ/AtpI family protein [Ilumatobacteraceae bacterium]
MSQPVSSGAEIVGGLVVFFLIGMGLDAWFGTKPIFMIVLTVFAVVAQFVRIYVVYSARMESLEARRTDAAKGHRP